MSTNVQALWGCRLDVCSLVPCEKEFQSSFKSEERETAGWKLLCPGPGCGELVELGFELGTVSSKALALGGKGGLRESNNPVRSLKNYG